MLCILRVKVEKDELSEIGKTVVLKPYRIDKDKNDVLEVVCMHYDVLEKDTSFSEGQHLMLSFLQEHRDDLMFLSSRGSELNLDVGINIGEDELSKSIDINTEFMKVLVQYKTSLTLSLYQTSKLDDEERQTFR